MKGPVKLQEEARFKSAYDREERMAFVMAALTVGGPLSWEQ